MLHVTFVDKGANIKLAYPVGAMTYQQFCAFPAVAQRIYNDVIVSIYTWITRDSGYDGVLENVAHSPADKAIMAAALMEASVLVSTAFNKIGASQLKPPVPPIEPVTDIPVVTPVNAPIEQVTSVVMTAAVPIESAIPVMTPVPDEETLVNAPIESVTDIQVVTPVTQAKPPAATTNAVAAADDDIPPMIPKPSRKTNKNRDVVILRTTQYARENFKRINGDWMCSVPGCSKHKPNVKYLIKHLLKSHNIVAPDLDAYLDRPL